LPSAEIGVNHPLQEDAFQPRHDILPFFRRRNLADVEMPEKSLPQIRWGSPIRWEQRIASASVGVRHVVSAVVQLALVIDVSAWAL
jgi:hypothetical protein